MSVGERPPRLAFAFPGVGTVAGPIEAAFFARHAARMRPRLAQASERAGVDLVAALGAEPRPPLGALPEQLLGYAFGCAVADVLGAHGLEPVLTVGHSMGLYAALYAAGAVDFATGLGITAEAYRAACHACPPGEHDLAAVVGFERSELEPLLATAAYRALRIVNSNNHGSHVLAGPRAPLGAFTRDCLERGALKALLLGVDLPYHHPDLLGNASVELDGWLGAQVWSQPRCPVVSPFDQSLLREPAVLRDVTARNLSTPIDWQRCVEALARAGVELAYECGLGATLVQSARLISPSPRFVGLKQLDAALG
jgi:[acyl-carrier-protein] S-malonyltransferase